MVARRMARVSRERLRTSWDWWGTRGGAAMNRRTTSHRGRAIYYNLGVNDLRSGDLADYMLPWSGTLLQPQGSER
jgi:hypothetical protein